MEMSFSMIKARIAEDQDERRQYSRHRVTLDATVRELGETGIDATVLNISEAEFEVGSRVWLMLPGRERANAVVKWIAGDKLGAEFAEPISLDGLKPANRRA